MSNQTATFDARALRNALGAFVTGVTVITTQDESGKPIGLTANSFNTVSLDPPLILWSQSKQATSYPVFQRASEFAVSILAEDQFQESARFASRRDDKFDGVEVDRDWCGLPVLVGSSAWLHCRTVSRVDGGDHTIFIGEVLQFARTKRRPLVFGGGQYLLAQPHDAALPAGSAIASGARQRHAVRLCVPWMQRIAEELEITICAGVWGNLGPTIVGWESGATAALPGFPLGLVLPVTASAAGKALAATLPDDITAPFVERELGSGPEASTRWRSSLEEFRSTGVALHPPTRFWNAELLISAASVAVRDQDGRAIVAMTAVVDSTLDPSVLAQACRMMQDGAAKVERQLGYDSEAQVTAIG